VGWLVVRDRPAEVVGYASASELREDVSFAAALRTPAFWIFSLASSCFGLVYSGIALFNQSILEQRGFDASTYHTVLVISTMIGLAANFAGGWLASWWSIQKLTGIGMGTLAASLLVLPVATTFAHILMYATAMGIAGGVVTVVFFSVWRRSSAVRNSAVFRARLR
jgi:predicted MFS family arabinose efflux permease